MLQAVWEKKYEIGIEDIDLQHHYFLNLINQISKAIEEKEGKAYIEALMSELDAYTKFHFKSEERMMLHSNYPNYEQHKNHHLDLIQHLSIEQYNLLNTSNGNAAAEVVDFLLQWFLEHTVKEDKLFADYLRSRSQCKMDDA